ncbi:MAG: methyltransferase domain-containing protein [Armatimonadetes bacterium]|nr:methyltransferase domain-containing protein [Armatimonadota bacterium]
MNDWNAKSYDETHDYVWQMGTGVVELLDPKAGELILDLGCGTGHLSAQIAARGAKVVGFDASPAMLETARREFPDLDFRLADARHFDFPESFDAVFSNAALHWIHEPELVIKRVAHHLKLGGRFVAEMGGKGNIAALETALRDAAHSLDLPPFEDFNYFPSLGEYATLLENGGFEVGFATLFDRPTPLDGPRGARNWLLQFRGAYLDSLENPAREAVLEEAEKRLRPLLLRDGQWFADYRRLRFAARKVG